MVKCPTCDRQAYPKRYARATGTVVGAGAGGISGFEGASLGSKVGADDVFGDGSPDPDDPDYDPDCDPEDVDSEPGFRPNTHDGPI